MKRFIRFCLLLCLPIILMFIFYIAIDPFKVVRHYDVYYTTDNFVGLNRGFVSAKHYNNHYYEYNYNSFIFGNSRSIAYYVEEWEKYIPKESVCYHFDANGGSVGETYYQIKFINEHGNINNALLIFDLDLLGRTEMQGILFSCPPFIKENKSLLSFYHQYFVSFYDFEFFYAFLDYSIHKKYKPYMGFSINNPERAMEYNPIINELNWNNQEEIIGKGLYYTSERIDGFNNAQFTDTVSKSVLNEERKELLKGIKSIFDIQNTNYRIIISPIYNQVKINPADLQYLYDVFGKEYVFDFSGPNKWTSDYHNYYETSHYRPCVANEIMEIVYKNEIQN